MCSTVSSHTALLGTFSLRTLSLVQFTWTAEVDSLIFQQDGTPPHFGAMVCKTVKAQFIGQQTGTAGPIS
jgi:hypothetical protein